MTAAELLAYITAGGAAMATLIKGGEWLLGAMAKRHGDRRTDLATIITRLDAEIERLKAETEKCEDEKREAEQQSARMEGVLYRMGMERTDRGWRHNSEGGSDAT